VEWVPQYVHVIWKCFHWHMSVISLPAVVTYAKNVWYLKCNLHLISTQDSRSTAVQFSLLSNWEVGGDCWYCCDSFGECDVNGGSLRFSWIVCHACYKDFDWIRSAGCSLHYQGIEGGIVTGVTRTAIPWWCKKKKESMNKATKQKVLERRFQILSLQ
jgi:hypothetical protein